MLKVTRLHSEFDQSNASPEINKRNVAKAKRRTTIFVKKLSTVSRMAQVLRASFAKSVRKQLQDGSIRSKYLHKFEVCDIVSPKGYVVLPKDQIALTPQGDSRKFMFKVLNSESVQLSCGTKNPSEQKISKIINKWIYLTPKTPHIVQAYEVFKDINFYLQLTEYCDLYDNVYAHIKNLQLPSDLNQEIPKSLCQMVFLYTIQISYAFAVAHNNDLTHGNFDLSQVICDENKQTFKITSFRPWLAKREYQSINQLGTVDQILSKKDKIRIAKHCDLYNFGNSLFELMIFKASREEKVVARARTSGNPNLSVFMPLLDSIPLNWVKMPESACLLEILHMCMTIKTQKDTVDLFTQINILATQQYRRFYDPSFRPLPIVKDISNEMHQRDLVVSLNNRAVCVTFKLMPWKIDTRASIKDYQKHLDFQQILLEKAVMTYPQCYEAQFNYLLLLWKQGKIFDLEVCYGIKERIKSRCVAQFLILMFRKAIGLPVDPNEEQSIVNQVPTTNLDITVSNAYKDFLIDMKENRTVQLGQNFETHLTNVIPGLLEDTKEPASARSKKINKTKPSSEIKKIFFSQNEKYCVFITTNQALVIKITSTALVTLAQIDLVDPQPLHQIQRVSTSPPRSQNITQDFQLSEIQANSQEGENPREIVLGGQTMGSEIFVDNQKMPITPLTPDALSEASSKREKPISGLSSLDPDDIDQSVSITGSSPTKTTSARRALDTPVNDTIEEYDQESSQVFQDSMPQSDSDSGSNKEVVAGDQEGSDQAEQSNHKDKIVTSAGFGFFNSPWTAAIDNTGTKLALHHSSSFQVTQNGPRSEILLLSGTKFSTRNTLQVGHLCPDEIVELSFDSDFESHFDGVSKDDSTSVDWTFDGKNSQIKKNNLQILKGIVSEDMSQEESRFKPNVKGKISSATVSRSDSPMNLNESSSKNSPRIPVFNKQETFKRSQKGSLVLDSGSSRQNTPLDVVRETDSDEVQHLAIDMKHSDPTQQSKFTPRSSRNIGYDSVSLRYSQPHLNFIKQQGLHIAVKCKNLKEYELDFSTVIGSQDSIDVQDQSRPKTCRLIGEPINLPGGAAFPVSFFKDPDEDLAKASKLVTNQAQKDLQVAGGFKTKHFEHMKQFIEKQEKVGNVVKMPRENTQHLIGYQTSFYKNRPPHFFIYEILKRKVIRRFLPTDAFFTLEWYQKHIGADANPLEQFPSPTLQQKNNEIQMNFTGKDPTPRSNTFSPRVTDSEPAQEPESEVNLFEVSPSGSFMISVVSQEMVVLKYLSEGMIDHFKAYLEPIYMNTAQSDQTEFTESLQESASNFFKSSGGATEINSPASKDQQSSRSGATPSNLKAYEEVDTNRLNQVDMNKEQIITSADQTPAAATPDQTNHTQQSAMSLHSADAFKPQVSVVDTQKWSKSDRTAIQLDGVAHQFNKKAVKKQFYEAKLDNISPAKSMSPLLSAQTMANALVSALKNYKEYVGSSHGKHIILHKLHDRVALALQDPHLMLNPQATQQDLFEQNDKTMRIPISTYKKCIEALKYYHLHFSVISQNKTIFSAKGPQLVNLHSKKTHLNALNKLTSFDQISFSKSDDQIRLFLMSTFPQNWYFAVFYRRMIQIYDQITGEQIFNMYVGAAQKLAFIDQEQLLVVQEGVANVYVCSIESQRAAFQERNANTKKIDAITTAQYEENIKGSEFEIGLKANRQLKADFYQSDNSDEEVNEDSSGVKVIRFDEDIKAVYCARNISPYGFIAIVGQSKVSVYLAYAEDTSCAYDHVWTVDFLHFRHLNIGRRIEVLDFSNNCEEFVAYTNIGVVAVWDLKKNQFKHKIIELDYRKMGPITEIRSVQNNDKIVGYSLPHNHLIIIDAKGILNRKIGDEERTFIQTIKPSQDGLGKLTRFQVDNSEQFLVCSFDNNKVAVYGITTTALVLLVDDPQLQLCCKNVFIDETCCFVAMLDAAKRQADIYAFEWIYNCDPPPKPKRKQVKTMKQETKFKKSLRSTIFSQRNKKSQVCALF